MPIQHIGFDQVPLSLNQPGKRQDIRIPRTGSGTPAGPSQEVSAGDVRGAGGRVAYQQLTKVYEQLQEAASTIRRTDTAMRAVDAALEKMQEHIEVASKQYRPYPPGNEERVQRLRGYAALRAMIDRLVLLPRDEARTLKESTPAGPPVLPDRWTYLVGWDGTTRTVLTEEVHTGPSGLRLPDLDPPEAVTNEALADAMERVGAAREAIQTTRTRFLAGAMAVPGGAPDGFLMSGDEAIALSRDVQEELAVRQVHLTHEAMQDLGQLLG